MPKKTKKIPKGAIIPLEGEKPIVRVNLGRPPAFNSPQEFEDAVGEYLSYSASDPWHLPNVAGMAYFLGISRDTLYEYGKKPIYSDTLKKATQVIEDKWVQRLGKAQAGGAIFYLKNAFREHYKEDYREEGTNTTNIFVLPREIATKHHLQLPDAPVVTEAKVIEEPPEINPSSVI